MRQIVRNAGCKDTEIVRRAMIDKKGYNVVSGQFEDLMETGIVDPLKVSLTAFENALSVALLALTTEVVVADKEFKD
jgi:chaperonin GroEL